MLGIDVEGLRQEWREGDDPSLRRRRRIAALCALGLADFLRLFARQQVLA